MDLRVLDCLEKLTAVVPNMYYVSDGTWVIQDGDIMSTIIVQPCIITIVNTIPDKIVSYASSDFLTAIGASIYNVYSQTNDKDLKIVYKHFYEKLAHLGHERIILLDMFFEDLKK